MHWWERERDVGVATREMAHSLLRNILYSRKQLGGGYTGLLWGDIYNLIIDHGMRRLACMLSFLRIQHLHCQVFLLPRVQYGRFCKAASISCWGYITLSHYGLAMLISLLRGQRVCVWIDSRGQSTVRTQLTTTKELISNQLPACFCLAPFVWLEWRAGYQLNMSHSHTQPYTHHLLPMCVCVCGFWWIWIILGMYVVTQWYDQVKCNLSPVWGDKSPN